ncbi:MAG: membrane protein insertase YidC [Proteobacteria bacterium]|nr:membrane protein insertase YidC [Pseudomonadota bacterium]MDA1063990.1 membrane protein insertase YidC [Pseudomonadota bacterium]
MDNQRLVIWAVFGLLAWMTYQAWQQDYAPAPQPAVAAPATTANNGDADSDPGLPELGPDAGDGVSAVDAPDLAPDPNNTVNGHVLTTADSVVVRTDVLSMTISTQGGTLTGADLLLYPVAKDRPDDVIDLLRTDPERLSLIQSGLRSSSDEADANHLAMFSSERSAYDLGDADEVAVTLHWSNDSGISVTKTYRFRRGSYIVGLEQTILNNSEQPWRGAEYAQQHRYLQDPERSMFDVDSYSFDGPILYDGEKAEKRTRDDLLDDGPHNFSSESGWFAAIRHHFVTAVVPERGSTQRYSVVLRGKNETSSAIGAPRTVEPGTSHTFKTTLFVGPKLQAQLEQIDKKLKLVVDYGWLTPISQPLFWLLSLAYGVVANWGGSIILITILIKLVFYKLTESSGRSMAKMRNLQPRIKALQERYKDDKQAQSQAMMEMYKTEKVNPAAGCLPILIQMPFFLAFYWVLLESVEMRQAPFALWITDLSVRDPLFILPLIMGAAMFFQQKLNPQVGDPIQIKVMQIMPIIFTAFFAFFPSGLVLYWVTNTLLSIAQQWKINKVVEAESKQQKSGKRTTKA